jgi:signal transduction histidine kinase
MGAVAVGIWVGQQVEASVINQTASLTGLYVDSVVTPYLQPLAQQPTMAPAQIAALDQLLATKPLGDQVVAVKVWSVDGTILYSPDPRLIGRRFPVEGGLVGAVRGWINADMTNLDEPENVFERQRWSRLLEVYIPVREQGSRRVIAVTEFYQVPDDLDHQIAQARVQSWTVVAGVFLITYVALAGIVRRGSDTIVRQQLALREQVAELSRVLAQNQRLRDRVHQAAGRTTALNEQALRRISADLHDGPGQALALALLRLESAREQSASGPATNGDFGIVQGAVSEALREIRAISAGLRLPELASLTLPELIERVLENHRRLTATDVVTRVENVPDQAPLAVKIALFRSLQEALSNATRHAPGQEVAVRVAAEGTLLHLVVSDRGPGFTDERIGANGRLGLAGMREQAELLGGAFDVQSGPERGTTLRVSWPLSQVEEEWPTSSD